MPLVLAVATCAMLLVLASASTTWRAYRGARAAMAHARADLAAERGAAMLVRDAMGDSLRERPLADTLRSSAIDAQGLTLSRAAVRPSPFTMWVVVTASEGGGGDPAAVRATRIRAERLAVPPWPIRAAVVSTSSIDSSGAMLTGTLVDDATDCFAERHAAIAAARQLPIDSVRSAWSPSWHAALARATPWSVDDPVDTRWRVHVIPERDSVLLGPRRWQGLVLHDGPLRLVGAFTGRGLLVVRGVLDASAAQLAVSGAVLIDDPHAQPVRLGPATVQWNRCAVSMALATVATPRSAPFHTWVGLTP